MAFFVHWKVYLQTAWSRFDLAGSVVQAFAAQVEAAGGARDRKAIRQPGRPFQEEGRTPAWCHCSTPLFSMVCKVPGPWSGAKKFLSVHVLEPPTSFACCMMFSLRSRRSRTCCLNRRESGASWKGFNPNPRSGREGRGLLSLATAQGRGAWNQLT